jgi:hypothetical protein
MENSAERLKKTCPMNGKFCVAGIRSDFEPDEMGQKIACRLWLPLVGKDPQSEATYNQHDCSLVWQTVVTLEASQMQRHTTASTDKVANALGEFSTHLNRLTNGLVELSYQTQRALEFKQNEPTTLEIPTNGKDHSSEES